ncbi:hypothetical protein VTN02DRAFT_1203 [Thermoascus thermophilus]
MLREHLPKRNVSRDNYYRLNVEVGVGEFGMNEWNRLADISTSTRRYLSRPEVQKMNHDAAVKLAKIKRAHRRLERRAAAAAPGSLSDGEEAPLPPASSPPPRAFAVELPGDIPTGHLQPPPPCPSLPVCSTDDKFTVIAPDEYPTHTHDALPHHATPRSSNHHIPPGRRSGSDIAHPPRQSVDHGHPGSRQNRSPSLGSEPFSAPVTVPPPLPPKTPISVPYPDDSSNGGGITMPLPPPPKHVHPGRVSNGGGFMPPYPVDGPPPVVNKLRKPTYNVR